MPPVTMADADEKKDALSFYEDEGNLKKLCNFLRSNEGPPVREAIEMEKRVYYLKGKPGNLNSQDGLTPKCSQCCISSITFVQVKSL